MKDDAFAKLAESIRQAGQIKKFRRRAVAITPKEILELARVLIREHASGDPDKWWYANRFVYARLQLDERKTKTDIRRQMLDAGRKCHRCRKPFKANESVHLHRVDSDKCYSKDNCVLMHRDCHQIHHAKATSSKTPGATRDLILVKKSKRYQDYTFDYWWDITPSRAKSLSKFEAVEFVKQDSGEHCRVSVWRLKPFLRSKRKTTRGTGNWGIKVLKNKPSALAFEPGIGKGDWLLLPVTWLRKLKVN
jgi:hypothetical protein